MKRIFLIIVIGLIHMSSFGQAKEIYVNDDLINISKAEFDKKTDKQLYFDIRLESDTLVINVKVDRIKKAAFRKHNMMLFEEHYLLPDIKKLANKLFW